MSTCKFCPRTGRQVICIALRNGLSEPIVVCPIHERTIREWLDDPDHLQLVPASRSRQGLPLLPLAGPGRREGLGDRLEGWRHPDSEAGVGQPASLSELELRYAWGDR